MLDYGFCPNFLLIPCNKKLVNSCQPLENRDRIVLQFITILHRATHSFLLFSLPPALPRFCCCFCCLVNVEFSSNPSTFGIIITCKGAQAEFMMLRCIFQNKWPPCPGV